MICVCNFVETCPVLCCKIVMEFGLLSLCLLVSQMHPSFSIIFGVVATFNVTGSYCQ